MNEKTCPKCGKTFSINDDVCPHCGAAVVKFDLKTWFIELSVAAKFALFGAIISIPSFLFNFGADAILFGVALLGIGFVLFLFKIGV